VIHSEFQGDEVVPEALTDPALQAARDRRWAKRVVRGSIAMFGFFAGFLADLFNGTKPEIAVEAQVQQGHTDYALKPGAVSEGASRFDSTIRLPRDRP
jgi:hypothetical protein